MQVLNKLRNKTILASTIGNVITILTLTGVIDLVKADLATKIVGLIILSLVQLGIFTNSEK
jgi:hypothetical protein